MNLRARISPRYNVSSHVGPEVCVPNVLPVRYVPFDGATLTASSQRLSAPATRLPYGRRNARLRCANRSVVRIFARRGCSHNRRHFKFRFGGFRSACGGESSRMSSTAVSIDWMCRPVKSALCRRRWVSAASPSTYPQCGTVWYQHCVTAVCH